MKKPRLYMMVTTDEYELPTAIADTAEELAEIAGTSEQVVNSQISRYEHGKVKETPFRRVFIEEDNEEMKDYIQTTKMCKEAYKKGLSNCQKDKFGCEYCDESVYLKKSGGEYEVRPYYKLESNRRYIFCPHLKCPYADEYEGFKSYEDWDLQMQKKWRILTP